MDKKNCELARYSQTWHAMRDFEEGMKLYARVTQDKLFQIKSPQDVVRYFHELYVEKVVKQKVKQCKNQ